MKMSKNQKSVAEIEEEVAKAISAIIKDKKIPLEVIRDAAVAAVSVIIAFNIGRKSGG